MSDWRRHGFLDDVAAEEGDRGWLGVNLRLHPALLPPGIAAEARNMRFRDGMAESRLGFVKLGWTNRIVDGGVQPYGKVHGAKVFSDPVTRAEYLITAADGAVYFTRHHSVAAQLSLPPGVTINYPVEFEQCFDVLVMFRGPERAPLVMESIAAGFTEIIPKTTRPAEAEFGTNWIHLPAHGLPSGTLVRFGQLTQAERMPGEKLGIAGIEFGRNYFVVNVVTANILQVSTTPGGVPITITRSGKDTSLNTTRWGLTLTPVDGTETIPNATRGVALANRLFMIHGSDLVAASELLDYTRYAPAWSQFRINQGSADRLVAISAFGPRTLIALKEHSVERIDGVYGDLQDATQAGVTKRYGCIAPRSVVDIGTDMLWLSESGVATLLQTEFGELQAGQGLARPPMFSDPIQPLIDRINWQYASGAAGVYHDNRYYLAVPLDDAETFRDELGLFTVFTPAFQFTLRGLIPGQTYRYTAGAHCVSLTNGTQTLDGSADFVAQGSTVLVTMEDHTTTLTASVRQVLKGVNNAVLIYDFLNTQWSGYDQAAGLEVQEWFKAKHAGRERLFFISPDGWVNLYEEDFEDQLAQPFTDVSVNLAQPPVVDSNVIRVNGGTTVFARASNSNSADGWGIGAAGFDPAVAVPNLFAGFYSGLWSAPNAGVRPLADGVRFIGTNGRAPEVSLLQFDDLDAGTPGHARITQVNTSQIETDFLARGYNGGPGGTEKRRARSLDLALATWNPRYSVQIITEGVARSKRVVTDRTRSRTRYARPYDKRPWDPTNVNDDFLTPHRGDYSVRLEHGPFNPQLSTPLYLGAAGMVLDHHQEVLHRIALNSEGRSQQIRITNAQGRIRILGAAADTHPGDKKAGVL
jgi:hypothetical protein